MKGLILCALLLTAGTAHALTLTGHHPQWSTLPGSCEEKVGAPARIAYVRVYYAVIRHGEGTTFRQLYGLNFKAPPDGKAFGFPIGEHVIAVGDSFALRYACADSARNWMRDCDGGYDVIVFGRRKP